MHQCLDAKSILYPVIYFIEFIYVDSLFVILSFVVFFACLLAFRSRYLQVLGFCKPKVFTFTFIITWSWLCIRGRMLPQLSFLA